MMEKDLGKVFGAVTFLGLARIFLGMFILVFPFQIRTVLFGDSVFLTGNMNVYDTFFIYFADLLLLLALIFWGLAYLNKEIDLSLDYGDQIIFLLINSIILIALLNCLFFSGTRFSILQIFRMLEMLLLFLMVSNEVLSREQILKLLIGSMVFQSVLAVAQYYLQHSVGLYMLGEPHIGENIPGVAKIDFNGNKIVRSYGTFLHPNILAAGIFMALMTSLYVFRKKIIWFALSVFILVPGFLMTFSRTSFLAFGVALIIFIALSEEKNYYRYFLYILCVLIFFVVLFDVKDLLWQRVLFLHDSDSISERVQYLQISKNMLMDQPWGVGMGNFTVMMQHYSSVKIFPWLMQPVHNVFMLIFNEAGIVGGSLVVLLFAYIFFRMVYLLKHIRGNSNDKFFTYLMIALLCGFVFEGLFDHYFFTSYQGFVLLFLLISLCSDVLKKFAWPLKKS